MFSSIFGKRRSSPVEETDTPPIPGAKLDDGFVVVNPTPSGGGLYPRVSGIGNPGSSYPYRPAPPLPVQKAASIDHFHYLQGVPFSLSKELQLATTKDTFAIEIGDLLAFFMNKVNMNKYDYQFSVEKSVLKEC